MIELDPFAECSEDANIEMDLDQPFDEGTPSEKQLTLIALTLGVTLDLPQACTGRELHITMTFAIWVVTTKASYVSVATYWLALYSISGTVAGGRSTSDQKGREGLISIMKAWMTNDGCASGMALTSYVKRVRSSLVAHLVVVFLSEAGELLGAVSLVVGPHQMLSPPLRSVDPHNKVRAASTKGAPRWRSKVDVCGRSGCDFDVGFSNLAGLFLQDKGSQVVGSQGGPSDD
ncbi:hypothetical protein B296_00008727 [Ensete ventricosum]|uniref:Uncharacterized protein n=1 Tax=Ensete ventricosum TaxID=4639 RepID=A0A426ZRK0_ENSVE|nr:hypothetical protein B296_00008727 [Ensete ventricosum]